MQRLYSRWKQCYNVVSDVFMVKAMLADCFHILIHTQPTCTVGAAQYDQSLPLVATEQIHWSKWGLTL